MTLMLVIATAIGSVFLLMSSFKSNTTAAKVQDNINYEMKKSKSMFNPEYELGDREIDFEYNNPYYKKTQKTNDKNDPKKQANKKSQLNDTKNKVTQNQVKNNNRLNNQKNNKQVAKNQDADPRRPMEYKPQSALKAVIQSESSIPQQLKTPVVTAEENAEENNFTELKRQLFSTPNKATADKIISLFMEKKITADTYYTTLKELFNQSSLQEVGIYMASQTPSVQSFTILVKFQTKATNEQKVKIDTALISYANRKNYNILTQVFQSSDSEVVTKASEVLIDGVVLAKTQSQNNSNINVVGLETNYWKNATRYFNFFIPVLQKLSQNQNQSISQVANETLSHLQSELI